MEHINWGIPVAIYLFTAGMGAAAFFIAVMADFAGAKKYASVRLVGAFIAPWPVILGVLFLIVDLGNPQRFWEMLLKRGEGLSLAPPYLMFNPSSIMSVGTWLLTIFVIISFIYLVVVIISGYLPWGGILTKSVGAIGLPFAVLLAVYTGVLLSATTNELWNNPVLPILFVVSATDTGLAGIIFILALLKMFKLRSEEDTVVHDLEKIDGIIIGLLLVTIALFIVLGINAAPMKAMIGMKFGILFWVGIVGLGLIVPLIIETKKAVKSAHTSLIVSVLILLGGFFLRYVILLAGQIA